VFFLQISQEVSHIAILLLQDSLGAVEHSHFGLNLVKLLLFALEFVVLGAQVGSVLAEIVFLHELLALLSLIRFLLLAELAFKSGFFHFELLHFFLLLLFFL